jgi:hypothetical protein
MFVRHWMHQPDIFRAARALNLVAYLDWLEQDGTTRGI